VWRTINGNVLWCWVVSHKYIKPDWIEELLRKPKKHGKIHLLYGRLWY
jgi:hypothetical protein